MPETLERLTALETLLAEVRHDIGEMRVEAERTRNRLHSLEGTSSAFLAWQKDARRSEAEQYRKLGFRIQVLTAIVGLAAIVAPIVTVLLVGK